MKISQNLSKHSMWERTKGAPKADKQEIAEKKDTLEQLDAMTDAADLIIQIDEDLATLRVLAKTGNKDARDITPTQKQTIEDKENGIDQKMLAILEQELLALADRFKAIYASIQGDTICKNDKERKKWETALSDLELMSVNAEHPEYGNVYLTSGKKIGRRHLRDMVAYKVGSHKADIAGLKTELANLDKLITGAMLMREIMGRKLSMVIPVEKLRPSEIGTYDGCDDLRGDIDKPVTPRQKSTADDYLRSLAVYYQSSSEKKGKPATGIHDISEALAAMLDAMQIDKYASIAKTELDELIRQMRLAIEQFQKRIGAANEKCAAYGEQYDYIKNLLLTIDGEIEQLTDIYQEKNQETNKMAALANGEATDARTVAAWEKYISELAVNIENFRKTALVKFQITSADLEKLLAEAEILASMPVDGVERTMRGIELYDLYRRDIKSFYGIEEVEQVFATGENKLINQFTARDRLEIMRLFYDKMGQFNLSELKRIGGVKIVLRDRNLTLGNMAWRTPEAFSHNTHQPAYGSLSFKRNGIADENCVPGSTPLNQRFAWSIVFETPKPVVEHRDYGSERLIAQEVQTLSKQLGINADQIHVRTASQSLQEFLLALNDDPAQARAAKELRASMSEVHDTRSLERDKYFGFRMVSAGYRMTGDPKEDVYRTEIAPLSAREGVGGVLAVILEI